MKYNIRILIGIALNLQIALGNMDILMMLIILSLNMVCVSIYLWNYLLHYLLIIFINYLLQFLSTLLYNFPSTGNLYPWLGLFLGTLFCLLQ